MVVIDSTTLLLMLRPDTPVPMGRDGSRIERPKERIAYLVATLEKEKARIIIPTPALSEALVRAGSKASHDIVQYLQKFDVFRIEPFDTRAAIEVAALSREALNSGNKRGNSSSSWAKVKFDRQIVAIARVHAATTIYSDDGDIARLGKQSGIRVISLAELPLPEQSAQLDWVDAVRDAPQSAGGNPEP